MEQLLRRMHLVRLRTSGKNRIFGILTQWGVRVPLNRLRKADGLELLERRGVPEVWRDSVREMLETIDYLDERVASLDAVLRPLATRDERARLLTTIPGVGPLLALTIATVVGDISRFGSASRLVGYSGLVPRIHQSGAYLKINCERAELQVDKTSENEVVVTPSGSSRPRRISVEKPFDDPAWPSDFRGSG